MFTLVQFSDLETCDLLEGKLPDPDGGTRLGLLLLHFHGRKQREIMRGDQAPPHHNSRRTVSNPLPTAITQHHLLNHTSNNNPTTHWRLRNSATLYTILESYAGYRLGGDRQEREGWDVLSD